MNDPGFKYKLVWLFSTISVALIVTAGAESPEVAPNQSKASRTKPQVIYHLPPSSPYAATLHSQAKRQSNELPIDSSMPASLQTSRANANAVPPPTPSPSVPQPVVRVVRPKHKVNRSAPRSHSFAKPPGHGNPHGNKSHKK